MTPNHRAQKLLIDIGCAKTVAEKKAIIVGALEAYAHARLALAREPSSTTHAVIPGEARNADE